MLPSDDEPFLIASIPCRHEGSLGNLSPPKQKGNSERDAIASRSDFPVFLHLRPSAIILLLMTLQEILFQAIADFICSLLIEGSWRRGQTFLIIWKSRRKERKHGKLSQRLQQHCRERLLNRLTTGKGKRP